MNDELEKLCETLLAEGVTVELKRIPKGWFCCLYIRNSQLYSNPHGYGATAVEAVNAACDQRLELLLRDGN